MIHIYNFDLMEAKRSFVNFDSLIQVLMQRIGALHLTAPDDRFMIAQNCIELAQGEKQDVNQFNPLVLFNPKYPQQHFSVIQKSVFGGYKTTDALAVQKTLNQDSSRFLFFYHSMLFMWNLCPPEEKIAFHFIGSTPTIEKLIRLFKTPNPRLPPLNYIPVNIHLHFESYNRECHWNGFGLETDSAQMLSQIYADFLYMMPDGNVVHDMCELLTPKYKQSFFPANLTSSYVGTMDVQMTSETSSSIIASVQDKKKAPIIDLSQRSAVSNWAQGLGFKYIHNNAYSTEQNLEIAPVSLLGAKEKVWGVYAKRIIAKGTVLGEYEGEVIDMASTKNLDYVFRLDDINGKGLDARNVRNWTAMVNSASSNDVANIEVTRDDAGKIYYNAIEDIPESSQLLIYYSDDYKYDNMRYLHPQNNYKESLAIFRDNESSYHKALQVLPVGFARLFNISQLQRFKVSDPFPLLDITSHSTNKKPKKINVDAPFLAVQEHLDDTVSFLPQNQQENITKLMWASWVGNIKLIKVLLNANANPNIQSSIHGMAALHIVVASDLDLAVKKDIIEQFLSQNTGRKYRAILCIQDGKNRTILHQAIEQGDADLATFILDKNKSLLQNASLLDCIDDNDRDPFMLALWLNNKPMILLLIRYMNEHDLKNYNKNDFQPYIHKYMNTYLLRDLINEINASCPLSQGKAMITQLQHLFSTNSSLVESTASRKRSHSATSSSYLNLFFHSGIEAEEPASQNKRSRALQPE